MDISFQFQGGGSFHLAVDAVAFDDDQLQLVPVGSSELTEVGRYNGAAFKLEEAFAASYELDDWQSELHLYAESESVLDLAAFLDDPESASPLEVRASRSGDRLGFDLGYTLETSTQGITVKGKVSGAIASYSDGRPIWILVDGSPRGVELGPRLLIAEGAYFAAAPPIPVPGNRSRLSPLAASRSER